MHRGRAMKTMKMVQIRIQKQLIQTMKMMGPI